MRASDPRRAGLRLAAVALLSTGLTACGGDNKPNVDLAPVPTFPTTAAGPPWNPCEAFTDAQVEKDFDAAFTSSRGTEAEPVCEFESTFDGGTNIGVNYQLITGSLDELFATFGHLAEGATTEITAPTVPGAEDARLVVDTTTGDLLITGFVQNGDLVQLVNLEDAAPFDELGSVDGVTKLLAGLSAHATDAGLNDEPTNGVTEGPTSSPTTDPP